MHFRYLAIPLLLLSGCASIPPTTIATPEALTPIQSSQATSKLIFISEVTVKLIDKKIGQMTGGLLCVGGRDLMWRSNPTVSNAVQQQIEKTLKDNGYNIYSGLLKAKGERDADVLIGVAMENIKANICYSVNGTKGSASLQLTWEVLDQKTNKSLYFSTYGASTISEFSVTGDPDLFVKAAEMATNNLLADKAFLEATRR